MPPGQETGHVDGDEPRLSGEGFDWGDYVAWMVGSRGSLASAALFLAERRGFSEDVESVERGLRRLRGRGAADGGAWGRRALRCFGIPGAVNDRIRWMGQYHTRFSDLPASLCSELLRPWERPPVVESPARIWLLLGRANLAIRARETPSPLLKQAALLDAGAEPAARAELALVQAYAWEKEDPEAAADALARVEPLLDGVEEPDRACLHARWVDQRAYRLNKPRSGAPDHAAAEALYRSIPADGPLFARVRRANGLGWSLLCQGDRDGARACAQSGVQAAGDSGSLRLRAMALNLLAEVTGDSDIRDRARAIAARLEDEALAVRFGR